MTTVRLPLSWLREHVDVDVPVRDLAHQLTMAGVETQARLEREAEWERIWVGRVSRLERHPNADRLLLATVEYGQGERTVVTGATNLKQGDVVAYAEVGAALIDGRTGERVRLEPRTMRGVRSEGMVCSERELGLGEDHEGILVLDGTLRVGAPLAEALGEPLLVAELSPNRSDCLGVVGIAREAAVLRRRPLRELPVDAFPAAEPKDFSVRIEDPAGCPRYAAAFLRGVKVGPSPDWMQRRLLAAGMRPINVVVDVTNYVMLETGQPLHAFDRRHLRGAAIVVRRARPGERIRTLDDVDRALDPSVLVIADAERAVALAGIIGGEDSEISPATTEVVLEVASFEPRGIGRTATALGLHGSEGSAAARRFAWDLSPELVAIALRRALRLLREHAGAEVQGAFDIYPGQRDVANVRVRFSDFARLLGVELPRADVVDALLRLGFGHAEDGDALVVTPPPWRTDVSIAEDVVEEAARIIGYERIPLRIPEGPLPVHERHPLEELRERVRDALVGLGLQEVVSYPLIPPHWIADASPDGVAAGPQPLRVTNPISLDQSVLRTTLEPSLLDTARRNLRWTPGVALFEIAPAYLPRPAGPPRPGELPAEERWGAGIVLAGRDSGEGAPRHWLEGEARGFDLHDLTGIIEGLATTLGLDLPDLDPGAEGLHPVRSAQATAGERVVVRLGQAHPAVAERWGLPAGTYFAWLDLAFLLDRQRPATGLLPTRFPTADRDLAVVVAEGVSWRAVRDEARSAAGAELASLALLDVYRGPQTGEGRKSFAMRFIFQSETGTLSDEQIDRLMRRVVGRLKNKVAATVRE